MRVNKILGSLVVTILAASHAVGPALGAEEEACPEGYRLHYQSLCTNIANELSDILKGEVGDKSPYRRGPEVGQNFPKDQVGYKFSSMKDGDYCKAAYVQLSKPSTQGPAAMALGDESCGLAGIGNTTLADAKTEAIKKCQTATTRCRIILTKDKD